MSVKADPIVHHMIVGSIEARYGGGIVVRGTKYPGGPDAESTYFDVLPDARLTISGEPGTVGEARKLLAEVPVLLATATSEGMAIVSIDFHAETE